ncbi:MAG TPA: cell division protein SepF [Chroococcidiopsis sp.]
MNLFHQLQTALGFGEYEDGVEYGNASARRWTNGHPQQNLAYGEVYGDAYRDSSGLGAIAPEDGPNYAPYDAPTLVGMRGLPPSKTELVLMKPHSFEEIPKAVMELRSRRTVVLDLSLMDADQAQRCADYVAGGVYAIDGHHERLTESVFLFTPSSVEIVNEMANDTANEMANEMTNDTVPQSQPQPPSPLMPTRPSPSAERVPSWAVNQAAIDF